MNKLVSVREMRQIEEEANQNGFDFAAMMENAGKGLALIINDAYSHEGDRNILGLVGSGNNGGDCLIALRELAIAGWTVWAYLARPRDADDELVQQVRAAGGEIQATEDGQRLNEWLGQADILLDGILGTGIKLPLKAEVANVLRNVKAELARNTLCPKVVAVDCPSGVDCDSGEAAEETLAAERTVCMAAVKQGLLTFPANEYTGMIDVVDIGLPTHLSKWESISNFVVQAEDVKSILPIRRRNAHKGTFGTTLVVAGSLNYSGAALLSAKAAYRIGTGLVTLAIPSILHSALAGHLPEATWLLLPNEMGAIAEGAADIVREQFGKSDVILLGPGWGQEEATYQFLSHLIAVEHNRRRGGMGFMGAVEVRSSDIPLPALVVDADALKLLTRIPDWPQKLLEMAVLTPHPGEMSILTGLPVAEIQNNRLEIARKFAKKWKHVVILKGAFTVIAEPGGKASVIPVATPALSRAGTGDVLSGIVAGLRAQGVDAYPAAVAGAWIHAHCGLTAEARLGSSASVLASDILDAIPKVFSDLNYS